MNVFRNKSGLAYLLGVSVAVCAAGLCPVAADASSVGAYAAGTVWGTNQQDSHDGTGLSPVAATTSYVRPTDPVDGRFSATAAAAAGTLGATASLSVTDAPGAATGTYYLYYGMNGAIGHASFQDQWIFDDQPLDTAGTIRLTFSFDGGASGSITPGGIIQSYGQFTLDVSSFAEFDNYYSNSAYDSGQLQAANESVTLDVDFLYGRRVSVNGNLVAKVNTQTTNDVWSYSGGGDALFGSTARLTGLQVADGLGGWTGNYALTTESGATYPFVAAVPAPTAAWLFGSGLLGLVGIVRRSSRRNYSRE